MSPKVKCESWLNSVQAKTKTPRTSHRVLYLCGAEWGTGRRSEVSVVTARGKPWMIPRLLFVFLFLSYISFREHGIRKVYIHGPPRWAA